MASQIWFTRSVDVDRTQVQTEGGYASESRSERAMEAQFADQVP